MRSTPSWPRRASTGWRSRALTRRSRRAGARAARPRVVGRRAGSCRDGDARRARGRHRAERGAVCVGSRDLLIGAPNAPRHGAAIPGAQVSFSLAAVTSRWPTTPRGSPRSSPQARSRRPRLGHEHDPGAVRVLEREPVLGPVRVGGLVPGSPPSRAATAPDRRVVAEVEDEERLRVRVPGRACPPPVVSSRCAPVPGILEEDAVVAVVVRASRRPRAAPGRRGRRP